MKAIIYRADGTTEEVAPKNGTDFKLDELTRIVDGYIEILYLKEKVMILNEEGKYRNKGYNFVATQIAHAEKKIMPSDWIVGDVLVCENNMVK